MPTQLIETVTQIVQAELMQAMRLIADVLQLVLMIQYINFMHIQTLMESALALLFVQLVIGQTLLP